MLKNLNITGILFVLGMVLISLSAFLVDIKLGFFVTGALFMLAGFINFKYEE